MTAQDYETAIAMQKLQERVIAVKVIAELLAGIHRKAVYHYLAKTVMVLPGMQVCHQRIFTTTLTEIVIHRAEVLRQCHHIERNEKDGHAQIDKP